MSGRVPESANQEGRGLTDKDSRGSRAKGSNMGSDMRYEHDELGSRDGEHRDYEKRLDRKEKDTRLRDHGDDLHDRESRRHNVESNSREDRDRRDEKTSRKYESESYNAEDRNSRGKDRRSAHAMESFPGSRRNFDEDHRHRSHR